MKSEKDQKRKRERKREMRRGERERRRRERMRLAATVWRISPPLSFSFLREFIPLLRSPTFTDRVCDEEGKRAQLETSKGTSCPGTSRSFSPFSFPPLLFSLSLSPQQSTLVGVARMCSSVVLSIAVYVETF